MPPESSLISECAVCKLECHYTVLQTSIINVGFILLTLSQIFSQFFKSYTNVVSLFCCWKEILLSDRPLYTILHDTTKCHSSLFESDLLKGGCKRSQTYLAIRDYIMCKFFHCVYRAFTFLRIIIGISFFRFLYLAKCLLEWFSRFSIIVSLSIACSKILSATWLWHVMPGLFF